MTPPRAIATIRADGNAEVVIDGVAKRVLATTIEQTRADVVAYIAGHARQQGRPIQVDTYDPEGRFVLTVNPDGSLGEMVSSDLPEDTIPPGTVTAEATEDTASAWGPPGTVPPSVGATVQPAAPVETGGVVSWMRTAASDPQAVRPQPSAQQPPSQPAPARGPQPSQQQAPRQPQPEQRVDAAQQQPVFRPGEAPQQASPWSQGPLPPQPQPQPYVQPGYPQDQGAQQGQPGSAVGQEQQLTRRQLRESFLKSEQVEPPATKGLRGTLARMGIRTQPSAAERAERDDIHAVSQHWPGVRTIAVVNGKGGAGKALAADEPVVTPHGYRPIGELRVGDTVIGLDGMSYPVLGVYPQGVRDLYDVTFTDGTTIRADGDHLWSVHTPNDRFRAEVCSAPECERAAVARALCGPHYKRQRRGSASTAPIRTGRYGYVDRSPSGDRLLTTSQILDEPLAVVRPGRGLRHRFFVQVAAPVKLDPTDVPLDPYLLGLLLGDGGLSGRSIRFSTADPELVAAARTALPAPVQIRHKSAYDYVVTTPGGGKGENPVLIALRQLGLLGARSEHKFVPEVYKYGDLDTRLAVLQGLMDTDGSVAKAGAAGTFTSVSAQLADDVQYLAQSLGCVVTRSAARANSYRYDGEQRTGQPAHSLRIYHPAELDLFRLERKRHAAGWRPQRTPHRAIAAITPAGRGEAVCISVGSPDNLFLARNFIPTHNTPTTALLAATFARYSGAATIAWDNNETRGTLGWRTEQGKHENTVLDLIPRTGELLDPSARAGDISHFVHHQAADKYDVLRSNPNLLSSEQRISGDDVDSIHDVLGRYYRLIFVDSGNDESASHWLRMIDKADQLVVPTIAKPEHAEAGALLLEALSRRGGRSAELARRAVVIVSQAREKDSNPSAAEIARGFEGWVSSVVTIPYDRAMVESVLRFDALNAATRRAWLRAAAAVARQL